MTGRRVVDWLKFAQAMIDSFEALRAIGLRVGVIAAAADNDAELRRKLVNGAAQFGSD